MQKLSSLKCVLFSNVYVGNLLELELFEKEWEQRYRTDQQFMQMAISDNGRQLWKRLALNRQEALQKVK